MKTLKLFNAVIAKKGFENSIITKNGLYIEKDAVWAKQEIITYYHKESLDGEQLNATFHKSWEKIKYSTRYELLLEQVNHYYSTYGSHFQNEIYIPNEILNIPDVKLVLKIVKAYSKDEMVAKALSLLQSGLALKTETIDDIIDLLTKELDYTFTGYENIKNKEALIKIADLFSIYPSQPVEFLRYLIFKATNTTLLIKNRELINTIKSSSYDPTNAIEEFGVDKLASIFNRFKPLFLAFKVKNPSVINKISKLSKTFHQPLIANPLNEVTAKKLTKDDLHWLDNATPFALFKALSACYSRMCGQDTFLYRVRNGKSWVTNNRINNECWNNFYFILEFLRANYNLTGKTFYIPKDIIYGLPTSEKMFVGNIPTGSQFFAEKIAVGIYWENAWGANDLDLSALNIDGKIGWNANYNQNDGALMYSGDITNAPNGAVEYLYANKGLHHPTLINCNVFGGNADAEYKIIIGKGEAVSYDYMLNPNRLMMETKCKSVQNQNILGLLIPKGKQQCFVLLNFGAGHARISGNSEVSLLAKKALYQQWKNPLSFNELIIELGANLVDDKSTADYDFSLSTLEKDHFLSVFQK